MNQKLADWASIADIVGAFAVTMSLIFVGLEIRGNTKATQAATLQQSVGYDVTLLTTFGSNPDIAATVTKYVGGEPELTESHRLQGQYLFAAALRHWENLYLQRQADTLSEEAWLAREAVVRQNITGPGFRDLMSSPHGEGFSGSFLDYARQVRAE